MGSRAFVLGVSLAVFALCPVRGMADEAGGGTVDLGDVEDSESPLASPGAGESRAVTVGEQIFDSLILRPFGAAATVGGMAFYLISVPLVAPSKNLDVTWDIFVLGPYDYTFQRPLGEF